MQVIRKQADTENTAMKAEIGRLNIELTLACESEEEVKTINKGLMRQNRALEVCRDKLERGVKSAQNEVLELQAWKRKIQKVCGAE